MPAVADERSRQAAEVAHARLLEQRAEEAQAAYEAADEEVSALKQQIAELERKSSAGAPLAEKVKSLQKNSKAALGRHIATTTTVSRILTSTT